MLPTKATLIAIMASLVSAQTGNIGTDISMLPSCALPCLLTAIGASGCSISDYQCQCTNPALGIITNSATPCVLGACSTAEALTTNALLQDVCKVQLGTSSSSSTAASSAASSASSSATSSTSATSSAAATSTSSKASSAASSASSSAASSKASSTTTVPATTVAAATTTTSAPAKYTGAAQKNAVGAGVIGAAVLVAMVL